MVTAHQNIDDYRTGLCLRRIRYGSPNKTKWSLFTQPRTSYVKNICD